MKKKILKKIEKCLRRIRFILRESNNKPKKIFKLSPTDQIDDKTYFQYLSTAINDKDLTNIALSGPYGSGKSSIIKAFEKEYSWKDNYNFLNISLASFKENKKDTNDENNSNIVMNELSDEEYKQIEKSILQQMFYKVDQKDIPNSRFKRIKSSKKTLLNTSLFLLWVTSIIELFTTHTFIYRIQTIFSDITSILTFVFALGSIYFANLLMKQTSGIKLSKLSLSAPEIDLTNNNSDISILNEHIDEILYFFDETGYNIVVIEDLDRFNNPDIFTKLREINNLLNNRKNKKKITFIYSIKDHMFKDKERTKFFDYLIPVVPFINSSNSYKKLKDMFTEADLYKEMDDTFLREISLYINDMRFLTNIFNEFIQYTDKLRKDIDLDYNKLFAISIYKNHKPDDFEKLHNNEGLIYKIFTPEYKSKIIKNITINLREEIKSISNKINKINESQTNSIEELRWLYIYPLFKKFNTVDPHIYLNSKNVPILEIVNNEDNFNIFKKQKNYFTTNRRNNIDISFIDLEKFVDLDKTYDKKAEELKLKLNEDLNEQQNILQVKKDELVNIRNSTIQELLSLYKDNDILEKSLLEDELLTYFIRYGFIDDDYYRFISYYHDGDETPNDINFLLNVKNNGKPYTPDLKLTSFNYIIKELRSDDYKRKSILNYSLLNYLQKEEAPNQNNYEQIIKLILNIIASDFNKYFNFLDKYIDLYNDDQILLKFVFYSELNENNIWQHIYNSNDYSIEFKNKYFYKFLNMSLGSNEKKQNFLERLDNTRSFSNFLESKTSYEEIHTNTLHILELFDFMKRNYVKFKELNEFNHYNEKFESLYRRNIYEINIHWIEKILHNYSKEELITKNYTSIMTSGKSDLVNYLHDNEIPRMNDYIENIYLKLKDNNYEDEKYLVELINSPHISFENTELIIESTKTLVQDIRNITFCTREFWELLLKYKKFLPSLQNIKILIEDKKFTSLVIEYLNDYSISKEVFNSKFDFKTIDELKINEIIFNDEIHINTFKQFIDSLDFVYDELPLNTISQDKVAYIIEKRKIDVHPENYLNLIENDFYDKLAVKLLESNPNEVMENYINFEIKTEHLIELIKGNKFNDSQKIELLNRRCPFDFPNNKVFLDNVYKIAIRNIDKFEVDPYLNLIESKLESKKKFTIFIKYELLLRSTIDQTLNALGEPYNKLTQVGYSPIFIKNTPETFQIVKKLKRIRYISSFSGEDKKSLKVNTFTTEKEVII